ncbi:MAG TPA: hypothetical protein VGS08_02240 [Candidatus Saccharimonadales bacterium]|nr:hypothetical protein [Candidatus Saccharimonadales bacterium]
MLPHRVSNKRIVDSRRRPYLVSSVVEGVPGGYVTYHIYARYPDATADRPIPITFNIVEAELSPETLDALNNMLHYGTPVSLPESAISDINIDMPAGLGLEHGSGSVYLGPARASSDQPGRAVWAIIPVESMEPVAQLTFEMEAPTRGISGGMRVHGVDTTGVVEATIQIDPPGEGDRRVSLSISIVDPAGKPVGQALPGLRFLRVFSQPNRLAFGREYGPLSIADGIPLPETSHSVPAIALEYTESLEAISRRSGKLINLPDLNQVDKEDYRNIIGIGRVLRGERVPVTWTSITAHTRPGTSELEAIANPLATSQNLTLQLSGVQHDLGQFYTYLLSARIEGDLNAEPDSNGNIPITIVPDGSDQAIMTNYWLTPEEVREMASLAVPHTLPVSGQESGL